MLTIINRCYDAHENLLVSHRSKRIDVMPNGDMNLDFAKGTVVRSGIYHHSTLELEDGINDYRYNFVQEFNSTQFVCGDIVGFEIFEASVSLLFLFFDITQQIAQDELKCQKEKEKAIEEYRKNCKNLKLKLIGGAE